MRSTLPSAFDARALLLAGLRGKAANHLGVENRFEQSEVYSSKGRHFRRSWDRHLGGKGPSGFSESAGPLGIKRAEELLLSYKKSRWRCPALPSLDYFDFAPSLHNLCIVAIFPTHMAAS